MKCLQCESDDIVRNLRVVDRGHNNGTKDLEIEVQSNPRGLIFKGTIKAAIRANVCYQCGFVMLNVARRKAKALKDKNRGF